jgi:hypothetical protein
LIPKASEGKGRDTGYREQGIHELGRTKPKQQQQQKEQRLTKGEVR